MTDFKNAVTDLVKNMFKSQFETNLTKGPASNNITLSDWNNLVDYCEHLINDVSLLTDFVKKIKNEDLLVNTVDTSNIVYGTNDKGEQVAIHAASIIGHLRLALVHNTANTATPTDDSFTLKIGYNEAGGGEVVVGEVPLDNFVQSYSKNSSYQNGAVYAKLNNKDIMLPTDLSRDRGGNWKYIVMRDANLGIPLPQDAQKSHYAASVNQVRTAMLYTDTLRKDVNTALDNLNIRVENLETTNIMYENYDDVHSQIKVPLTASPNAAVRLIGGLSQKSENLLPNGYADLTQSWTSLGGAELEEGVTYWLELDYDPNDVNDVQLEIYYPPESGFGSEYVQPGEFIAPVSGAYTFNLEVRSFHSSKGVSRLRILKYPGIKSTEVKLLRSVDADGGVHYNYSVPSVQFAETRFSLGDGLSHKECNYLDLTRNIIVGNYTRIVFTGYENWYDKSISGAVRYCTSIKNHWLPYVSYKANGKVDYDVPALAICDTYDAGSISALNSGGYGFAISSTDIYFYDKNFPNVETWQGYLQRRYESGNPLTVVYKVATPHTENVTLPYLAYLISVKDSAYINVLDKDDNLVEAPVSITFTKLRGI